MIFVLKFAKVSVESVLFCYGFLGFLFQETSSVPNSFHEPNLYSPIKNTPKLGDDEVDLPGQSALRNYSSGIRRSRGIYGNPFVQYDPSQIYSLENNNYLINFIEPANYEQSRQFRNYGQQKPSLVGIGSSLPYQSIFNSDLPVPALSTRTRNQFQGPKISTQCDSYPRKSYNEVPRTTVAESPGRSSVLQKKMLDMFYDGSPYNSFGTIVPDLSSVTDLIGADAFFYGMNPRHMLAIHHVKSIFMQQRSGTDVYLMANALRFTAELHPTVWYEALMRAVSERPDMAGMSMPGPMDTVPDSFIPSESFNGALGRIGRAAQDGNHRAPIPPQLRQPCARIDGSVGEDNGVENVLWYWREDIQLNSNHWYWHLANPINSSSHPDRRGELFYYFHHGILARYNMERMSNGLPRVQELPTHRGAPLNPPYNAHLDDTNSAMRRTDRPPNTPLSDIDHSRNPMTPQVISLDQWRELGRRLATSIGNGYLVSRSNTRATLPTFDGIDLVGHTIEATNASFNPDYYESMGYHNDGHFLIALSVDPFFRLGLPPGPMGDPATAIRDPIFYPWHTNIDNLFDLYKRTLPPYQPIGGEFPLLWRGVEISVVRIRSSRGLVNQLRTFWNERNFELGVGLAFDRNVTSPTGNNERLQVCARHLDHEEFVYQFRINRKSCASSFSGKATVRIFLGPRHDENGNPFSLSEQRRLFVPLDYFTTNLNFGQNIVTRSSLDSTLTIPWGKTLQQLQAEFGTNPEPYCGCGWPHHLLLPRGTLGGRVYDLFVMVTNGDENFIRETFNSDDPTCRTAPIYCGIQNRMYPDARPMGYPFDRYPYQVRGGFDNNGNAVDSDFREVETIEEYVREIPNMAVTQITIFHAES